MNFVAFYLLSHFLFSHLYLFTGDQKDYGEADLVVDESHVIGITEKDETEHDGRSSQTLEEDGGRLGEGGMEEAPASYTTSAPHSFTADPDQQLVIDAIEHQDDNGCDDDDDDDLRERDEHL